MAKQKKTKGGQAKRGKRMLGITTLITAAICLPSAVIVFIGMMPAFVAGLMDRTRHGIRGWTVGAMNAAGCFPFLLELWSKGNSFQTAMNIVADPRTIIVIYSAAGIGYMIDWALTGLVATFLTQKGERRKKTIEAAQSDLVERWGREVTGDIPLDIHGFPLGEKTS